jgi:hypothetical protein
MKLTSRHACALLCVAVGQLGKSELFEEKQNLLEHDPSLLGYDRAKSNPYFLTEHGQFVVAEMLKAMENAT